jgi:hypothetical protein
MRAACIGLVVISAMSAPARADGDSLVDMLGPREIAVGEAMRGGATGATAIGLNPAGIPLNRELVFEGGYGYRASDQASILGVSACDSTNALPGCFFYDYIGANPELDGMSGHRHTHIAGTALSYMATPHISLGASVKYFHSTSDGAMPEPDVSGFTTDIGATLRLTELINVGVAGYNLWSTADSPEFVRAVGGGVLAHPIPILALSFDTRWKLDGDQRAARYGGGGELFLRSGNGQAGFPIRGGALHDNNIDTTYLSGGLGYTTLTWGLDVTARKSISGVSDSLVIASMRFFGPRQAAPGLE